jgi:hypothetical protein
LLALLLPLAFVLLSARLCFARHRPSRGVKCCTDTTMIDPVTAEVLPARG